MVDESDPSFAIPRHPQRHFTRTDVEYRGGTIFSLRPRPGDDSGGETDDTSLQEQVEAVLSSGPYRFGDWFDLPLPVYLVHDEERGEGFRVAVRDGTVELHVRPETTSKGLRRFYRRLVEASAVPSWDVERRLTD